MSQVHDELDRLISEFRQARARLAAVAERIQDVRATCPPRGPDALPRHAGLAVDPSHPRDHAVQFYGSDDGLFRSVAGFLAEGLVTGQPAIVIATVAHRASILDHLSERLIDCVKAIRHGDLTWLDAEATLDLFMIGDAPDPDLFEARVGGAIARMIDGRPRTIPRAYGEMVDVLWKQGRSGAAIKLEILWNTLALKYRFALLCGLAMDSFSDRPRDLEEVIAQHTHVMAHDSNIAPFPTRRARSR